jgi:C-terminal processing protease CtpA/Prc
MQGIDGVGIVLEFSSDLDHPKVSSLVPGKSASACGLIKIGDVLMRVDSLSTQKRTFDEIRSMIAGPVGTYVSLSFQGSEGAYECEKLVRGNVQDNSWSTHASQSTIRQAPAAASSALPSFDLFGTNEVQN